MSDEWSQIAAPCAGRADSVVRALYPNATRSQVRELFARGGVRQGRRTVRKGDVLAAGDVLSIIALPESPQDWAPKAIDSENVEVLTESAAYIAINKPPGMHSHPMKPGEHGCAANVVAARYPECAATSDDPREGGLIHRLDGGTSGVLVFARTREAWLRGREALSQPTVDKTYLALCASPAEDGECSERIENGSRRVRGGTGGQAAKSQWRVLDQNPKGALLRVNTFSGRRHQVRFHLATGGYPILGDELYGGQPAPSPLVEFFLHAESLAFPGLEPVFAPLPDDRTALLNQLGLVLRD